MDRALVNLQHTVRVALAGVARADRRAGKQMVAQMLAGSKASKIPPRKAVATGAG